MDPVENKETVVKDAGSAEEGRSTGAISAQPPTQPQVKVSGGDVSRFRPSTPETALDQWRGLALVCVLLSHGLHENKNFPLPGMGRVGVNLFFFISGILVYRSMVRETGLGLWASFKNFLGARLRRLVPALYAYLLFMGLVLVLFYWNKGPEGYHRLILNQLAAGAFYYTNFQEFGAPQFSGLPENTFGHLWSVACEVQFYALAPLIFWLGGGHQKVQRTWVWGVILVLMMAGGASILTQSNISEGKYSFAVAAWPMMLGFCLERARREQPGWIQRLAGPMIWSGMLALVLVPVGTLVGSKKLVVLSGLWLIIGAYGCYVRGWTAPGAVGRSLFWLGNRTYSIYLYQQPLTIAGMLPAAWHPWGALLSIVVGALSFRWFEKPFMSKFRPGKKIQSPSVGQSVLSPGGVVPTTDSMATPPSPEMRVPH